MGKIVSKKAMLKMLVFFAISIFLSLSNQVYAETKTMYVADDEAKIYHMDDYGNWTDGKKIDMGVKVEVIMNEYKNSGYYPLTRRLCRVLYK